MEVADHARLGEHTRQHNRLFHGKQRARPESDPCPPGVLDGH